MNVGKKIVLLVLGSSLLAQSLLTTASDGGGSRWSAFTSYFSKLSFTAFKPSYSWFKRPEISEEQAKILKPVAFGGVLTTGLIAGLWKIKQERSRRIREDFKAILEGLNKDPDDKVKSLRREYRDLSDKLLIEEICQNKLTNFFTAHPYRSEGICRTGEVSSILRTIKAEKATRQTQAHPAVDKEPAALEKDLAKDIRELPNLGKLQFNRMSINKYLLSFRGRIAQDGRSLLRVGLFERMIGYKEMQDVAIGRIVRVPCLKNKVLHMVYGTENADGTFDWKKTIHKGQQKSLEPVADAEEKKSEKKQRKAVSFNDDNLDNFKSFNRWDFREPEKTGSQRIW